MLVAVGAADPVDVVRALRIREGRVHLLHIDAAVRHLRMTGLAGSSGVLVVSAMAGDTTDTFMHSDRGAIVAGADLRAPVTGSCYCAGFWNPRRMALVTKRLPLVGAELDGARTIEELR